jgi:hypothetical protein
MRGKYAGFASLSAKELTQVAEGDDMEERAWTPWAFLASTLIWLGWFIPIPKQTPSLPASPASTATEPPGTPPKPNQSDVIDNTNDPLTPLARLVGLTVYETYEAGFRDGFLASRENNNNHGSDPTGIEDAFKKWFRNYFQKKHGPLWPL